jgi:hypothetical protein
VSALPVCPACSLDAEGLGALGSFALGVAVADRGYSRRRVLDATCAAHRPAVIVALGRATIALHGSPRTAEACS